MPASPVPHSELVQRRLRACMRATMRKGKRRRRGLSPVALEHCGEIKSVHLLVRVCGPSLAVSVRLRCGQHRFDLSSASHKCVSRQPLYTDLEKHRRVLCARQLSAQ